MQGKNIKYHPVISIITVTYNAIETINSTFQSVFAQSYNNIEYIVIDGGSIDGTTDIIKMNEKNIRYWISEEDTGIYDAMNKGISIAQGDWIIFMNSGDIFHDDNVLQNIFTNNINCKTQIIYGNTKEKNSKNIQNPPKEIIKKYFIDRTICHQSILFKKGVFDKIGYFDLKYKIIADRDWLLRATINDCYFQYIDIVISVWDEEGFSKRNYSLYISENKVLSKSYFTSSEKFILIWKLRFYNYKSKILKLISFSMYILFLW